jgi:hypothetical protein
MVHIPIDIKILLGDLLQRSVASSVAVKDDVRIVLATTATVLMRQ